MRQPLWPIITYSVSRRVQHIETDPALINRYFEWDHWGRIRLAALKWSRFSGGEDDIDGVRRATTIQGCLFLARNNDSSEKMMHWRVESSTEECMAATFGSVDAPVLADLPQSPVSQTVTWPWESTTLARNIFTQCLASQHGAPRTGAAKRAARPNKQIKK